VATEEVATLQSWYNAGVDFNLPDYNGRSALHVAVAHGRVDHVAYLLQHGADPRAVDVDGRSPIDVGRQLGLDDIVAQLNVAAAAESSAGDSGE